MTMTLKFKLTNIDLIRLLLPPPLDGPGSVGVLVKLSVELDRERMKRFCMERMRRCLLLPLGFFLRNFMVFEPKLELLLAREETSLSSFMLLLLFSCVEFM